MAKSRERIIEASIELFKQHGYHEVSVNDMFDFLRRE